jgi:hypothetical protein
MSYINFTICKSRIKREICVAGDYIKFLTLKFNVFTAVIMKKAVLWDAMTDSSIGIFRCFGRTCCLLFHIDEWLLLAQERDNMFFWNVVKPGLHGITSRRRGIFISLSIWMLHAALWAIGYIGKMLQIFSVAILLTRKIECSKFLLLHCGFNLLSLILYWANLPCLILGMKIVAKFIRCSTNVWICSKTVHYWFRITPE